MACILRSCLFVLLLFLTILLGSEARSVGQEQAIPELFITSSISLNSPLFGEVIGPLIEGQQLTLTCSTETSEGLLLSWWEGGTEQYGAELREGDGLTSVSLTIASLSLRDSGRHLTCREKGSEVAETVELQVQQREQDEDLQILLAGHPLYEGEIISGTDGEDLSLICVHQGYSPSAVSWWEGDVELLTVIVRSPYATSSVLSIRPLTVDDSGRSFTCRADNGQLSRTVNIDAYASEGLQLPGRTDLHLLIYLSLLVAIFVCVAVAVIIILLVRTQPQQPTRKGTQQPTRKEGTTKNHGSTNRVIGFPFGKTSRNEDKLLLLVNECTPAQEVVPAQEASPAQESQTPDTS